eukprot:scaffold2441_cov413-Prasinococcus_capsulatus_cf.AAC.5
MRSAQAWRLPRSHARPTTRPKMAGAMARGRAHLDMAWHSAAGTQAPRASCAVPVQGQWQLPADRALPRGRRSRSADHPSLCAPANTLPEHVRRCW